jgi:hypothetical protein
MTDSHNSGLTAMGRRMLSKAAIQLEPLCLSRRSAPRRVSLFGGYEKKCQSVRYRRHIPRVSVNSSDFLLSKH